MIPIPYWLFILFILLSVPMAVFLILIPIVVFCVLISDYIDRKEEELEHGQSSNQE